MGKGRSQFTRFVAVAAIALAATVLVRGQVDPATALVERDGWNALAAGRIAEAAEAFDKAITRDPSNARLHLGAAAAALLDRRYADCRRSAERALSLDPHLFAARRILGQVLYRTGDVQAAINQYEQLAADAPDDSAARETLARWRREVALRGTMQEQLGNHFTISFQGAEQADVAARAMEALESAYWRIGAVLSAYPLDPVPVVLYTNEQFRDITRSPAWAAAAFDGTIRVPIRGALSDPGEFDRVLAHEYTHAVVRSIAVRGVPAWVNEGLAAALERGDVSWADDLVARAGRMLPLSALDDGFGRFDGAEAAVAYATSAIAMHRLIEQQGGFAVTNILNDIAAGIPFADAFARRMQQPLEQFSAGLSAR